jgi:hypothetical protein
VEDAYEEVPDADFSVCVHDRCTPEMSNMDAVCTARLK